MPSTNKTPNIGLNQWEGADKPKRTDFNADNAILDKIISELHTEFGAWQPQIKDATGKVPTMTSSGTYEKRGKQLRLKGYITITANSMGATSATTITIPDGFVMKKESVLCIGNLVVSGYNLPAGYTMSKITTYTENTLSITVFGGTQPTRRLNGGDLSSSAYIWFDITVDLV